MPSNTVKFTPEKSPKEKRTHGLGITIFSGVVLVVIVVTFIGAPVVSKVSEQPSVVFGTYDGAPIEYLQGNYFAQEVEYLNRFYEQFQTSNTDVNTTRSLVWRQAFNQAALQVALKKEATRSGIVVTDKLIDQTLVKNSNYQQDGQFSEELYRNTSDADKFRYRQDTETQLLIDQYVSDQTSNVRLSSGTQAFIASFTLPQRKFSYVTFVDADYPANLVADYGQKNKTLFRTINLSRITVTASEAEAKKVREEALKGTKTFEELAKAYSKDPLAETGGALNTRAYYELKSEIAKVDALDKIYALPKGGISDVLVSDKSWVIYKVVEAATDADLTKPATLDLVRNYLISNDKAIVEDYLDAQGKAFQAAAATNFEGAAKAIGKSVSKTEWVALNFGNDDLLPLLSAATKDAVVSGQSANEDFFKKAFRTPVKGVSAPVLAGNAVLVLRVDEEKTVADKGDTPLAPASIESRANNDRSSALQQSILSSSKFKDGFQAEFNRLFPQ